jgi:hypothetical protein
VPFYGGHNFSMSHQAPKQLDRYWSQQSLSIIPLNKRDAFLLVPIWPTTSVGGFVVWPSDIKQTPTDTL